MTVTYATARAACVARYGREPDDEYAISACARSWWARERESADGVLLSEMPRGAVELAAIGTHNDAGRWTLAGPPTASAPAATLPAALDAADAFLRDATKGP